MTSNAIAYFTQREEIRSNKAREHETSRHNRALEEIEHLKLQLARDQHGEVVRHNQVSEGYNFSVLGENIRHNMASEVIGHRQADVGFAQVGLGYAQLAETERAHKAAEEEIHRHQTAMEGESQKHNRTMERLEKHSQYIQDQKARRENARARERNFISAYEAETQRQRAATYQEEVNNNFWFGLGKSVGKMLESTLPIIAGGY